MSAAVLRTWAQAVRRAPELVQLAPADVAEAAREFVAETAGAGRDPDGTPWPATEDGDQALARAAERTTVDEVGNVVVITVTGPTALHHLDRNGPPPQRRVIPSGIPDKLLDHAKRLLAVRFGGGFR